MRWRKSYCFDGLFYHLRLAKLKRRHLADPSEPVATGERVVSEISRAGEVAEWSNASDSKSDIPLKGIEGSNPSLSAIVKPTHVGRFYLLGEGL